MNSHKVNPLDIETYPLWAQASPKRALLFGLLPHIYLKGVGAMLRNAAACMFDKRDRGRGHTESNGVVKAYAAILQVAFAPIWPLVIYKMSTEAANKTE